MVYDPYAQAPAYSSGSPDASPEGGRGWDPYTGVMTGGGYDRNMVPGRPITQTSWSRVPTREDAGSPMDTGWHLNQEAPAQRVRGAMVDAFQNAVTPTPEQQAYKERMNTESGAYPWVMRNAVLPAFGGATTVAGGLSALGAGAIGTADELANAAGIPGVGRDLSVFAQTAPAVRMAAGPLRATPRAVPLEERGPRFTGKLTPEDVTAPEVPGLSERPSPATGIPGRMEPPPGYVPPFDPIKTATEGKIRAGEHFDIARDKGGTLQGGYTDRYLDELQKDAKRLREGSDVTGPNVVTDAIDSLENQRGKPLTLQAAWNIDKWLGKKISAEYDAGGLSEYGRELQGMQRRLKEHIDNAGEGDITGGKEGFEALKKGRQTYTIATRMSDLERMEEIAQGTLNPQQSLRTQINRYVNHEAKTRGWTDSDIADLKKAGQRGTTQEVMASLSSRLLGIGATATAGPLAGVATTVATKAARDVLTDAHMRQIQSLRERMGMRAPPAADQPGAVPGPRLLPRYAPLGTVSPRGLLGITAATEPDERQ